MKYKKVQNGYLLRLEKGEEIIKELINFTKDQNLTSGFVSAIGAVASAELGFYHIDKKEYSWEKYEQNLEIASLTGNIAFSENDVIIHLHGVFADEKTNCFGGHLREAKVGATCEVFITELGEKITRSFSDEIGLKLMDL